MKAERFSLFGKREIKCKTFLPEGRVSLAVLGVHGFAGDKESSMLSRLGEALSKVGGALICFDFPAHGESPEKEDSLTVAACCEDLLFIADHLRKEFPSAKKAVFATSFGGYISLLCSDNLCDFSYVLRAPAVSMPDVLLGTVLKTDRESFEKAGHINCGFERKIDLPFSFSKELDSQISLFEKELSQPALIIHGSLDDIVPLPHILKYCCSHPAVRLEVMDGADHRFKGSGELKRITELSVDFLCND